MSAQALSAKLCSRCSADFSCGAAGGHCWCFDIAITPQIMERLREDFTDCLCAKCLSQLAPMSANVFLEK